MQMKPTKLAKMKAELEKELSKAIPTDPNEKEEIKKIVSQIDYIVSKKDLDLMLDEKDLELINFSFDEKDLELINLA
ncbi:MAG: hypothetical protein K5978_06320 [Campylobacter sp.]|nr:hypothetical protein [Campylobacter sp.]